MFRSSKTQPKTHESAINQHPASQEAPKGGDSAEQIACSASEDECEQQASTPKGKVKRIATLAVQLVLLIAVYELGCLISQYLPIAIPGNIVGMALLLTLLATGILKAKHVGDACDYMVDNMSIFFIPAGVGIMGCFSLLQEAALKFALVCVVTTVIVFLATSLTVMVVSRIMEKLQPRGRGNREVVRLNQEA